MLEEIAESEASASTLASIVYARVRKDIVQGALQPGEKLRIESLIRRYDVGASPIREALSRLSADGLVARQDQKGFRVTPADSADLDELLRTRCLVNEITLRESIKRGDKAWEDRVILAGYRFKRVPSRLSEGSINPEWDRQHKEFHSALIEACGSRWLIQLSEVLFDCTDRYRHLVNRSSSHSRDARDEHQQLMDAVLARDADRAVRLLNEHVSRTLMDAAALLGRMEARSAKGHGMRARPAVSATRKRKVAKSSRSTR